MEWQSMKSAPRDGENILLVFDDGDGWQFVDVGFFSGRTDDWEGVMSGFDGARRVTHWMPLDPPSGEPT